MTAIKYDAHSFLASPDAALPGVARRERGEGSVCPLFRPPPPLFPLFRDEFSFPFLFAAVRPNLNASSFFSFCSR